MGIATSRLSLLFLTDIRTKTWGNISENHLSEKSIFPHTFSAYDLLGILLFRKWWWFSQSPRESSHGDQRLKGGIPWRNPSPWNISQVSTSKVKGTRDQYYLQKEYFTLLAKRKLGFTYTTLSSWNYHLYQSPPGRTWFSVLLDNPCVFVANEYVSRGRVTWELTME